MKTPHVTDNGHHSPLPSCLCTPKYLTKHTWRRHTRLRHTHNSVGSALHTHRRDPDTRIQVGHTTNTHSQYTLQFNTQVRHVRSVRALGPEGPSRVLTLKRPGLCGWLRPTQFKPRLNWVGSAAQVRRYCVDSAAQAFIHALAGCVPRSLQYALCGPRNSRSAHFAAHALDVLTTHESPSLTQLST